MASVDVVEDMVMGSWCRGRDVPPPARTLAHLFDAPHRESPTAEALVHISPGGRRSWTYAELDNEVERRAAGLAAAGVGPGERIGVVATRVPALVPTVLALLRLGATYVPIDPAAPDARWALLVAEAGLTAVTGPADHLDRPALTGVSRLAWEEPGTGPSPRRPDDPALPAYVLFTSGSTGVPKGVVVSHANVLARIASYLELTDGPVRYLLHSSLCFDGAVGGMFSTLARGGCLVLPSDDLAADPGRVAPVIRAERITHVEPVPSWYGALLDLAPAGSLATVRAAILGGEVLPPVLAARHHLLLPQARLFNDYGPTETTVAATCFEVPADWAGDRVPIGRPHANTTVAVLDEAGRPVSIGEVGELCIGGPGVALGYLNRPDDPAFHVDPARGDRRYATGDLARWRDDGQLELLGRRDRQAKVRGQRVEPGEVEVTLAAVQGVGAAAVEVDRSCGGDRLVAYVAPPPGATLDRASVTAELADRLPPHLRPDVVVVLDALPCTPGGKVDRQALAAALPTAQDIDDDLEPPADSTEAAIARVWSDVLGRPVGVDQDFFALGGHSLLAARMVTRLRRELGLDVELRDLASMPTIRELAAAPRRSGVEAPGLPEVPDGPAPLAPNQDRLWYLHEVEPNAAYHEAVVIRIDRGLDVDAFATALDGVVERQEWLRSVIAPTDDGPRQVVRPAMLAPLERVRLGPDEVERWVAELERRPFDLAAGPPWRAGLAELDDATHVFALVLHHIACDATALDALLAELGERYDAALKDEDLVYEDLPPVAAIAAHLRARCESTRSQELAADRADALAGTDPGARIPADVEPTGAPTGRVSAELTPSLAGAVHRCAESTGVPAFAVVTAAVAAVVAEATGRQDVALGVPVDLRWAIEGAQDVVAFLVETAAIPVRAPARHSLTDTARAVREAVTDALAEPVPFEAVVTRLRATGELPRTGTPLQVYAGWLEGVDSEQLGALGPQVTHLPRPTGPAKFDLHWTGLAQGPGITLQLEHDADRISEGAARRLLDRVLRVLEVTTAEPERALGELDLLLPADRQALVELEGTLTPNPVVDLLTDLGGAGAVDDLGSSEHLDAAELWHRVDALAAVLIAEGVEPGDRIGVSAHRCAGMVVAVLAVLRAGASFVPLDPRHPVARQRGVLSDAEVRLAVGSAAWIEALAAPGVAIDDGGHAVTGERAPTPTWPRRSPDDVAYVMFTSGSTGRPKGVVVTDANVVARVRSYANVLGADPVRYLLHSALGFDASVYLFWVLANGGTLVVPTDDAAADPAALTAVIDGHDITDTFFVPSLYELVIDAAPAGLPSLRQVCVGGESFPPPLAASHRSAASGARLWNVYGPTETVVTATSHLVEGCGGRAVPIGRPHPGTLARVLGPDGRPVPPGAPGELHLGGPAVSAGYLGRPDETAARFRIDADGVRWYATGDLVRWREDGALDFLGRRDRQVKLRGQRIELAEIEVALRGLPDVDDAVAEVVGTGPDARLLALVTPSLADESVARRSLGEVLPRGWVPDRVVSAPAIPRLVGGKVDRAALAEVLTSVPAAPATGTGEKGNPAERFVAASMASLLDRIEVGLDDDFFDLGGHSLLAARLVAALDAQFGVTIALADLIDGATPRRLADIVNRGLADRWAAPSSDPTLSLLREGDGKAPLVVVARDGESGLFLRHFLRQLDDARPLWVLLRPAPAFGSGELPDFAAQGRASADVLRAAFPDGPIHVLGHSASGMVALEVARALGDRAGATFMLDTHPPVRRIDTLQRAWDASRGWVRSPGEKVRWLLHHRAERRQVVDDVREFDPLILREMRYNLDLRAVLSFRATRYDGEVVLFTTESSRARTGRDDLHWRRWCPQAEVVALGGDHLGMLMHPLVDETIASIDQRLSDRP